MTQGLSAAGAGQETYLWPLSAPLTNGSNAATNPFFAVAAGLYEYRVCAWVDATASTDAYLYMVSDASGIAIDRFAYTYNDFTAGSTSANTNAAVISLTTTPLSARRLTVSATGSNTLVAYGHMRVLATAQLQFSWTVSASTATLLDGSFVALHRLA